MEIRWDIHHYEDLQEAAWEHDALATEQDRDAKRHGRASSGVATRAHANELRVQAARMLARYWVLPR